jgi:hypothetical protein
MPFDGANFQAPRTPRKRASRSENVLTVLILVAALGLLVLPVSAAGLIDIAIYLGGR